MVTVKRLGLEFDIILLTECWLGHNSVVPSMDGYHHFSSTKYINQSGGVVAYIRRCWTPEVCEPNLDDADCLQVFIPGCIALLGVYRSPSFRNTESFTRSLESVVIGLPKSPCQVIAGDININICQPNACSEYLGLMAHLGYRSAVDKPTRGDACLDHVFISTKHILESLVCTSSVTDHDLVMAGISLEAPKPQRQRTRTKLDLEAILLEIQHTDWQPVYNKLCINAATQEFMGTLNSIIEKNTRVVKITRSKLTLKPWMTPGLLRCSSHKDKLHREVRRNPDDLVKKHIYKRYRNFYQDLIRKLKLQYDQQELKQNANNSRKLWNAIKRMTHTVTNKANAHELCKIKDTPLNSLNYCNSFYSSLGQQLANQILSQINETEISLSSKIKIPVTSSNSLFLHPTTPLEVESIILQLNNNSAPGHDKVTNELVKLIKNHIIEPLTYILNLAISSGVFPNIWKMVTVTPVYKGGKIESPNNYRPISLLSVFSKILEKIVNKQLVSFLKSHELLSNHQFGFRQGRSTEQAVVLLTDMIGKYLDEGQSCLGIFLDLAKAFDTVSIPILLKKLESIGIRGIALDFFRSYLTSRRQCLKVDGLLSGTQEVTFGIPQGSVLGPTLFLVYINDLSAKVHSGDAEIINYADDTVIIFHERTWSGVFDTAQIGFNRVVNWLNGNLLSLNIDKTNVVCFYKNASSAPPIGLNIVAHACCIDITTLSPSGCNCTRINRVKSTKYLGIIIDEKLTFGEHIAATSARVRKVIYVMKILRDVASMALLRTVYQTLCESIISYCITAWGGTQITHLIGLERAQRAVLKTMIKKSFRFPTTLLYDETQVLSVRRLYILKITLNTHKEVINSKDYQDMINRRVYKLPLLKVNTMFAKRFCAYMKRFVYNRFNKVRSLAGVTSGEAKLIIQNELLAWTYDQTESFLKSLS